MKRGDAKEMAELMADFVNVMDGDRERRFVEEMALQHRTLQQGFTRLMIEWIKHLAKVKHYDPRNEASVMLARKIKERLDETDLHMPLI